jgi:hypothetical protein
MDDHKTQIEERLRTERPLPHPAFRGALRRRLLSLERAGFSRPRQLRLLLAAYASTGVALLAVALVGVLGVGPLAA